MVRLPWRAIIGWAALGWVICLAFTLANLSSTSDQLGGVVDTGHDSQTAPLLQREIGDSATKDGGGHDGAFFYALAESPLHPDAASPYLDRPRYRAQRILFPLAVWIIHPTGGGPGLVFTMFAVGALGVLGGGIMVGALSCQFRGSPRWGVAFGLLPGTWISLRISTPDPLAVALALAAVLLMTRRHLAWAVVLGVAAVLTKEPVWLVLLGYALFQRDRKAVIFAGVPALAAGLWWLYLHAALPVSGAGDVVEFVAPFSGWSESARFWRTGAEPLGLLGFLLAVGCGLLAVLARRRHPLWWAVLLNLGLTPFLAASVLAPERNSVRTLLALQVVALIAIVSPAEALRRRPSSRRLGRPAGSLKPG
jgi:hypothetical protein